jgi:hypothetical protein
MSDVMDLVQTYSSYDTASTTLELVEIGPARVLALQGRGEPGGAAHLRAIETLYAVVHGVQTSAEATVPFLVPPLDGLWWVDDDRPALEVPREEWRWELLLRLPDHAQSRWLDESRAHAGADADRVELTTLAEGLSVQALPAGPMSGTGNDRDDGCANGARAIDHEWAPSRDLPDPGDRASSARQNRDDPPPPGPAHSAMSRVYAARKNAAVRPP